MRTTAVLLTFFPCFALFLSPARAEIGIPGAPGGFYFSMEGGYQQSNNPGVAAQGASTVVPGTPAGAGSSLGSASGSATSTPAASSFASVTIPPVFSGSAGSGTGPGSFASANAFALTTPSIISSGGLGVGAPADANAMSSIGTQSATASPDGGGFIHADQGGYSVFSLGYVLPAPIFGFLSRIEVYGGGSFADSNESVLGAFGLRSVDNNSAIAFSAAPINSVTGSIYQEVNTWEVGFRLKADEQLGPLPVAFSAEPFYINYLQDTTSTATLPDALTAYGGASANRLSNVGASLYGAQFATEAVVPLFGKVSLIGRGSAGIYGINANANFSSLFSYSVIGFESTVVQSFLHDEENRLGARLGAQAGLRYAFSPSVWLSLIGTVDYLSEVPTAVLPREVTDPAAHIGFTGELDWRVGMRLTLAAF